MEKELLAGFRITVKQTPLMAMLVPMLIFLQNAGFMIKVKTGPFSLASFPRWVIIPVNIFSLSSRLYGRLWIFTKSCPVRTRGLYHRLGVTPNPERTNQYYYVFIKLSMKKQVGKHYIIFRLRR